MLKQSIRLSGVGRTAHTFYRRVQNLFFSDSSEEEYQSLFLNGSRRRKGESNKKNASPTKNSKIAAVSEEMRSNRQHQDEIRVERVTKLEEPAIYVIDNFLTNSELDYFDQKIDSISFERSFVDNMGYDDDEDNDDNDNVNQKQTEGRSESESKDGTDVETETQKSSSVCGDTSTPKCLNVPDQQSSTGTTKKKGKKMKKRKRRTIVDDTHRTSTFYSFRKLHDSKISSLEQRIANLLGCWVHQIEALQLVRYLPGQFFGVHHDLGNLLEDDSVELPRKDLACKRRLVTIFCYLNTLGDDEGGCTYFPKCGDLRVKPQRGRAVLWCNITPDGKADSRTIHAGEAVKSPSMEASANSSCAKKSTVVKMSSPRKSSCKTVVESRPQGSKKAKTTKYGLNIWICEE